MFRNEANSRFYNAAKWKLHIYSGEHLYMAINFISFKHAPYNILHARGITCWYPIAQDSLWPTVSLFVCLSYTWVRYPRFQATRFNAERCGSRNFWQSDWLYHVNQMWPIGKENRKINRFLYDMSCYRVNIVIPKKNLARGVVLVTIYPMQGSNK